MTKPKVSVIVPVYKVENSLGKCVDSLLNQTLEDIEIILVDDGSPDRCPQLCDELSVKDARIKVIHKENGGLGYARNSGMDIAEGEYIGFVDSDDYVKTAMYKDLYEAALKYQADAAYSGYTYVFADGSMQENSLANETEIWEGKEEVCHFLMDMIASEPECRDDSRYGATVWKGIFRRSLIDGNNIRFYSERDYVSEDGLFDIDFFTKANKVVMIPGCYYYYQYNPVSLTAVYRKGRFEQNKALFALGSEKLKNAYNDEKLLLQYSRMFLAAARVCVMQEANNTKKNGFGTAAANIRRYCSDPVLQNVLNTYPWKMFDKKRKLFAYAMQHRLVLTQMLIVKLNKLGKH